MQITVSRRVNNITEYLYGEDDNPLAFSSFNEALQFFYGLNYTLRDIMQLDFEVNV